MTARPFRQHRVARAVVLAAALLAAAGCASPTSTPTAPPAPTSLPTLTSPPTPPSTPSITPSPTPTTTPTPIVHTVQPGDTLLGLALQYGVPMAAIQLENGMGDSTILHVGDPLTIPPGAIWAHASPYWIVYLVRPDETLDEITQRFGLSLGAIEAVNQLDGGPLEPGRLLILPLDTLAVSLLPTPTPTPTATPTPAPTLTPTPPASSTPLPVPTAGPPADVADWPYETVRIINEIRAQHGLAPYVYNEALALAAQNHANDCAQRGWGSHVGSEGADLKTRIIRAGYEPTGWAECWAWNQSPQAAVDAWMDEVPPDDAHLRTLLSTWVTEIGVGVAQTEWGYYFIADFGRP